MWEIWCWDGKYIKGKLVKRYKTKQSAFKYVEKNIEHKEIIADKKTKDRFYIEGDEHTVGLVAKKKTKK
tara:strand:- start:472 stop:678 length:207 start_codon:yes stop_codon:yes gene_type:complete